MHMYNFMRISMRWTWTRRMWASEFRVSPLQQCNTYELTSLALVTCEIRDRPELFPRLCCAESFEIEVHSSVVRCDCRRCRCGNVFCWRSDLRCWWYSASVLGMFELYSFVATVSDVPHPTCFTFSNREKDIWKSKDAAVPPIAQHQLAENRHTVSTHHSQHSSNNNNHHLIAGNEADKSAQIASVSQLFWA